MIPRGFFELFGVDPVTLAPITPIAVVPNLRMHTAGFIEARCCGFGNGTDNVDYRLRAFYFEFENVADPDDAVTPPAVAKTDDVSYYTALSADPDRDYVRVLTDELSFSVDRHPDYAAVLAADRGNRLSVRVSSTAGEGVHGKEFSAAANSKIFGVAVAAAPIEDDPLSDILFARSYYTAGQQLLKADNMTAAATYRVLFSTGL